MFMLSEAVDFKASQSFLRRPNDSAYFHSLRIHSYEVDDVPALACDGLFEINTWASAPASRDHSKLVDLGNVYFAGALSLL